MLFVQGQSRWITTSFAFMTAQPDPDLSADAGAASNADAGAASSAELAKPLTPDQLDWLDHTLDLLRERNPAVADWEFCEGFMVALICTRRPIAPDEYWPVLFGDFVPAQHMQFVWLWKQRWRNIERALDTPMNHADDELEYWAEALDARGILLALAREKGEAVDAVQLALLPSFGQNWAFGFLSAIENWSAEWTGPRDAEAAFMLSEALDAIARLSEADRGLPETSPYEADSIVSTSHRRIDEFAAAMWAAWDLRRLWKTFGPRTAPLRKAAQPGRNDPCPCGSGKKYKRCHGG
ncbi:MAG: UPF0149 family protein [Variovorax sp.]